MFKQVGRVRTISGPVPFGSIGFRLEQRPVASCLIPDIESTSCDGLFCLARDEVSPSNNKLQDACRKHAQTPVTVKTEDPKGPTKILPIPPKPRDSKPTTPTPPSKNLSSVRADVVFAGPERSPPAERTWSQAPGGAALLALRAVESFRFRVRGLGLFSLSAMALPLRTKRRSRPASDVGLRL